MSAVWMRLHAELRLRGRGLVGLALIVGVAGGTATAAAAGARRTDSAYDRFVVRYESYDVIPGGIPSDDPLEIARIQREIATLPQVAEYSTSRFVSDAIRLPSGQKLTFPEVFVLGDATGREGFDVNRIKIIEGRLVDRASVNEAMADFTFAERVGLHVGDRVDVALFDPSSEERKEILRPVTIVGIGLSPGGMPAAGAVSLTGIWVTPAFIKANEAFMFPNEDAPSVRLDRGSADIPAFIEAAKKIEPGLDFPTTLPLHLEGVRRTLRFEVISLWVLAGLIAAAAMAIFGQALARQTWLEAGVDYPILRSLGMNRRALFALGMTRACLIGSIAAVVAVPIATAASPLAPIGLSRIAEPDPGISIDGVMLGVGALLTFVVVLALSAGPAWRAGSARNDLPASARTSSLVGLFVSAGASPSATAGLGMAFRSGRGARAVPVRQAIVGVAAGTAALLAAAIFAASLTHLIRTPSLYGYGWDVMAGTESDGIGFEKRLRDDPDVAAWARGGFTNVIIAGKSYLPFISDSSGISPTILEGRAPRSADEIAIGTSLMRTLKTHIGGTIQVAHDDGESSATSVPFKVVGRTVIPPVFFRQLQPGEGSAMTVDGFLRVAPGEREGVESNDLLFIVRYRDGVKVDAKIARLRDATPDIFVGQVRGTSAELTSLKRVSSVPVVLAGIVGLMALAVLIHATGSTVRRRRRELAILKTLGFSRRQVRGAVFWQATALCIVSLVVGLPLGLIAGRLSWRLFAESLGVIPLPIVTVLPIILAAIGTLVIANLAAAVPGFAAARTQPAVVLRTE